LFLETNQISKQFENSKDTYVIQSENYAPVDIKNIKLEMIIDTGSPVTLIAEH
jgi:hypothetical protein